ncbi:MAG TPA: ribbon-helix-helix protein, CopG family [Beijerinckiaceae bacterium]|jgi:predicted transcriptional regulator
MAEEKVQVSAELSKDLLDTLEQLARQRGVSANTVLQQAIQTEKFFADTVAAGKKVLLQNNDKSMEQVRFKHVPA